MSVEGILLRRERLRLGWSQEGLCKGICAVSYLSKIEQGRAAASEEIVRQLFARMGITWQGAPQVLAPLRTQVETAYDALFSFRMEEFQESVKALEPQEALLRYSPFSLDAMLLTALSQQPHEALPQELEACMDARQLALQRALQNRFSEAIALYPRAYFYYLAGDAASEHGRDYLAALELFQTGFELAAKEGSAHLMLLCRALAGNCYCNMLDVPNMLAQYEVAQRLAKALGDGEILETIRYNTAAVRLETGEYAEAYAYYAGCAQPTVMTLHKLAICCEKLGRREEALAVLDRADRMESYSPDTSTARRLCALVRMRLENPEYLHDPAYGEALLAVFAECRERLPIGYASFHLPWVLEWYTAARQYKQAYELLRTFPKTLIV